MLVSSWPSFSNPLFPPNQPSSVYNLFSPRFTSMAQTLIDPSSLVESASSSSIISQRDPLSELKNIPSSCVDRASAFFKVLTSPYVPLPPIKVEPEHPMDPCENERYSSVIDWSRPSKRADSPPDDQDALQENDPSYYEHINRAIYKPHAQWAWSDGLAIEDSTILSHLGTGRMCSANIKHGILGGRRITFISKSWLTQEQNMWQGFHSELTLYKSDEYLKPLQGLVVPTVIGVHVLPGEINVAMEPPHHSFWMEASADMPIVLKERCIEAFEKLHFVGILHGDVELRHMLIGGDGKVTIIDFQGSRALIPNDAVMLRKAEPADFLMEMRKVKYKLDYGDSREKELQKVIRCDERATRNRVRRYKHKRRSRGERPGFISDYEDDPKEDKAEPPVHKQDWNEHWVVGADAAPRRFVMPGQTPEQLEHEVQHLLAVINRLQLERDARKLNQSSSQYISTPPPTPTTPSGSEENTQPFSSQSTSQSHSYSLRKRKATAPLSTSPTKRPRSTEIPPSVTATTSNAATPVSESVADQGSATPSSHLIPPTTTDIDSIGSTSQSGKSSFSESIPDDRSVASPSTSTSSCHPPIKIRDFAYEAYDGPRGYYVPHPPTEARAAKERQWHIARLNAQKCLAHKLPHPAVLAHLYGDAQVIRFDKGKKPMVQFGSLKRAREDVENPNGARAWSAKKKARYELAKKVMNGESASDDREQEQDDALNGYDTTNELSGIPEGPRILTRAEYEARLVSNPLSSTNSNPHGILRETSPIRQISQRKEDWMGTRLEISPKLGPADLHVGNVGNSVMLGAHFDSFPDDHDHDHDERSSGSRWGRNVDRAGSMVALATLGVGSAGSRPRASHVTSSADVFARSDRLQTLIGPPPQRKKYTASRGQLSSMSSTVPWQTCIKFPLPALPPRRQDSRLSTYSEDVRDEIEIETILRPMDAVEVTAPREWMSMLLRFFRS